MLTAAPVRIPCIGQVSPEVFDREYVRTGTPIILRAAVADWPASRWDVGSWAERWPTRSVSVDEPPPAGTGDFLPTSAVITLSEFAQRALPENVSLSRPAPVLCSNAEREMPELLEENPAPGLLGKRDLFWILFGGYDPVIHGHYHSRDNVLMCQVRGQKRGVLYPPSDTARLYPHPIHTARYNVCQVNLQAPDSKKFPKFRHARAHEVFLEPGDALFIPVHWWHSTRGFGASLSVSLAWNARLREHRFPQPGARSLIATAVTKARSRIYRRR